MGSPPSGRKRRYFGPGDGKKWYLLTGEGDIYTLDSDTKLVILDEFPERGAVRWRTITRRVFGYYSEFLGKSAQWHIRDLINAGLVGILVPENRKISCLHRDKLYRTDLNYEIIDVNEAKRLLNARVTKTRQRA